MLSKRRIQSNALTSKVKLERAAMSESVVSEAPVKVLMMKMGVADIQIASFLFQMLA